MIKKEKKSHHLWSTEITMIGHSMPLIRLLLILRKFRVHIISLQVNQKNEEHWSATFLLDFELSTRTDTVFKKLARLYDVEKLSYQQGKKLTSKAIILK